jgi:hypothetical protein
METNYATEQPALLHNTCKSLWKDEYKTIHSDRIKLHLRRGYSKPEMLILITEIKRSFQ